MKEANKLLVLYTRDFGLIYVGAQSIRNLNAKMKYHVQSYNYIDVDIIRGRDVWRLTGVHQKISSLSFVETPWYPLCVRLSEIIQRLCKGEESNHELWKEIQGVYEYIGTEFLSEIEIILVARILHALGYWSGDEMCVVSDMPYSLESISFTKDHKRTLIRKINQSFVDSQL